MKNIPGKTLILIVGLITLTVVLLGVAIWAGNTRQNSAVTTSNVTPSPVVAKTATISFSPTSLDLSGTASNTASVDIIASTGNAPISGAQVELIYNPTVITNVKFLPPDSTNSLFGPAGSYMNLFTDIKTPGDVTYALAIQPAGQPVTGTGSIGKVTFSVVKGGANVTMTFGKGTIVTAKGVQGSVLNTTTPLTIKLSASTAPGL